MLPLAVREPASAGVEALLKRDPEVVLWWGTAVECAGALARAGRRGMRASARRLARAAIEQLRARAWEVRPVEEVRARAERLRDRHALGAAAALQLAAALAWCRERPAGAAFVCLDPGLRAAAAEEGFKVLPYADEVQEP